MLQPDAIGQRAQRRLDPLGSVEKRHAHAWLDSELLGKRRSRVSSRGSHEDRFAHDGPRGLTPLTD
jgi:hypothetical protein